MEIRLVEGEIYFDQNLRLINCCICAVTFGLPEPLITCFKNTKTAFFCPFGHQQQYQVSTREDLENALQKERKNNEDLRQQVIKLRARLDQAEAKQENSPPANEKPERRLELD